MYFLQSLKTKVLIIPRSKKYKAITLTLDSAVLTINPSKNVDQRKEKEEEKQFVPTLINSSSFSQSVSIFKFKFFSK